jgi:sulfate transport system permease protein
MIIMQKLEQYKYVDAAALGCIMLVMSFIMLLSINLLQAWSRRRLFVGKR